MKIGLTHTPLTHKYSRIQIIFTTMRNGAKHGIAYPYDDSIDELDKWGVYYSVKNMMLSSDSCNEKETIMKCTTRSNPISGVKYEIPFLLPIYTLHDFEISEKAKKQLYSMSTFENLVKVKEQLHKQTENGKEEEEEEEEEEEKEEEEEEDYINITYVQDDEDINNGTIFSCNEGEFISIVDRT